MKETWESCESLTTAVGNLELLMVKKMEGLYDKFSVHLTVMFARWVRKSALKEPQMLYKMIMWNLHSALWGVWLDQYFVEDRTHNGGRAPYLICGYRSLGQGLECLLSFQSLILCLLYLFWNHHFFMPHLFHWYIQFCCICPGNCFLVFKSPALFPPAPAGLLFMTAMTRKTNKQINNFSETRNSEYPVMFCASWLASAHTQSTLQILKKHLALYLTWVTSLARMNSDV